MKMEELADEEIPIETRIFAPITYVVKPRFKIQDIRENIYDEVLLLIKVRTLGTFILSILFI